MNLDLIKTTFANNSLFTIFFNKTRMYEEILKTIEKEEDREGVSKKAM